MHSDINVEYQVLLVTFLKKQVILREELEGEKDAPTNLVYTFNFVLVAEK